MALSLIINADDFGARPETNQAIIRCLQEGVLTSASLMVNEPAAQAAADLQKEHPNLAVGLHLTLSDGCAALPHSDIPLLTDDSNRFPSDPVRAGMRYFLNRGLRKQLKAEMRAQFERYLSFGLPFDHVNGHQHMHMTPIVWDNLIPLCEEFDVRAVRIPYEEFRPANRERPIMRRIEMTFFNAMRKRNLRSISGKLIYVADRVYGQQETGNMNESYVIDLLTRLKGEVNEVYFHPGTLHARPLNGGERGMDVDQHALLSVKVRRKIEELGIRRTTYTEIGG
jgi:hopanoid biosynthesis associated protein HpnK